MKIMGQSRRGLPIFNNSHCEERSDEAIRYHSRLGGNPAVVKERGLDFRVKPENDMMRGEVE